MKPTEHKTVQARILAFVEAILTPLLFAAEKWDYDLLVASRTYIEPDA